MKKTEEKTTWEKVMALKGNDKRHRGIANGLTEDEITTILATYEFFGASNGALGLISFDLKRAQYRVFDWLAMMIGGRYGDDVGAKEGTRVMAHSFIKSGGDVDKFIADLRENDYDMDKGYEKIII